MAWLLGRGCEATFASYQGIFRSARRSSARHHWLPRVDSRRGVFFAARLIAGSRLEVYEGGPHGLFVTHMDRLNPDLAAFALDRS
jgi:hypothetical protein